MAYVRPTVAVLKFRRNDLRYTLRADLHNRRITSVFTRVGGACRKIVKVFPTREEAREYLERVLDRRDSLGYEQVA